MAINSADVHLELLQLKKDTMSSHVTQEKLLSENKPNSQKQDPGTSSKQHDAVQSESQLQDTREVQSVPSPELNSKIDATSEKQRS